MGVALAEQVRAMNRLEAVGCRVWQETQGNRSKRLPNSDLPTRKAPVGRGRQDLAAATTTTSRANDALIQQQADDDFFFKPFMTKKF